MPAQLRFLGTKRTESEECNRVGWSNIASYSMGLWGCNGIIDTIPTIGELNFLFPPEPLFHTIPKSILSQPHISICDWRIISSSWLSLNAQKQKSETSTLLVDGFCDWVQGILSSLASSDPIQQFLRDDGWTSLFREFVSRLGFDWEFTSRTPETPNFDS